MGWRIRKVFNFGPLRTNLSKKGIGYSFGIPGLRFGKTSTGKDYVSFGIPFTGIYFYKYLNSKKTNGKLNRNFHLKTHTSNNKNNTTNTGNTNNKSNTNNINNVNNTNNKSPLFNQKYLNRIK